jgi:hypothetical protein
MRPALAADTAVHVRGAGAVLEVVPASCRQGGLQSGCPLTIGLGESPHLVRCQAEVPERRPERLECVDGVQKLLPQLDW